MAFVCTWMLKTRSIDLEDWLIGPLLGVVLMLRLIGGVLLSGSNRGRVVWVSHSHAAKNSSRSSSYLPTATASTSLPLNSFVLRLMISDVEHYRSFVSSVIHGQTKQDRRAEWRHLLSENTSKFTATACTTGIQKHTPARSEVEENS